MSAKSLFLKQNVRIAAVGVAFPVKMRQGDFAVALGNKGSPAKSGGVVPYSQKIKIGFYDCPGMLFRGSYSLLLV